MCLQLIKELHRRVIAILCIFIYFVFPRSHDPINILRIITRVSSHASKGAGAVCWPSLGISGNGKEKYKFADMRSSLCEGIDKQRAMKGSNYIFCGSQCLAFFYGVIRHGRS
jgi:hypothetical protein